MIFQQRVSDGPLRWKEKSSRLIVILSSPTGSILRLEESPTNFPPRVESYPQFGTLPASAALFARALAAPLICYKKIKEATK